MFCKQVCQSSLLSDRNVRWPRRCCSLVSHSENADRTDRETDRQTNGHQTVTLRFPLDTASVMNNDNDEEKRTKVIYDTECEWHIYNWHNVFGQTLSSRLIPNPDPVPESRGCISSTVRNRLSDVVVRKSISALGCRP